MTTSPAPGARLVSAIVNNYMSTFDTNRDGVISMPSEQVLTKLDVAHVGRDSIITTETWDLGRLLRMADSAPAGDGNAAVNGAELLKAVSTFDFGGAAVGAPAGSPPATAGDGLLQGPELSAFEADAAPVYHRQVRI
jgi:hypothetical protein